MSIEKVIIEESPWELRTSTCPLNVTSNWIESCKEWLLGSHPNIHHNSQAQFFNIQFNFSNVTSVNEWLFGWHHHFSSLSRTLWKAPNYEHCYKPCGLCKARSCSFLTSQNWIPGLMTPDDKGRKVATRAMVNALLTLARKQSSVSWGQVICLVTRKEMIWNDPVWQTPSREQWLLLSLNCT